MPAPELDRIEQDRHNPAGGADIAPEHLMSTTTAITTLIAPEATTYVAELGLQPQFEQMLEHTRRTVPGLRSIAVELQPPYDVGGGPCVLIEATREDPHLEDDPTGRRWDQWQIATFPPEVFQHFVLIVLYEQPHAG
jgi:hypothetical protein